MVDLRGVVRLTGKARTLSRALILCERSPGRVFIVIITKIVIIMHVFTPQGACFVFGCDEENG